MVSAGASTCPLGMGIIVHCREGGTCVALAHQLSRTTFAVAALGGNAQLELDFVKAQTRPGVAGNFSVRNSAAYTDDHGGKLSSWLLIMSEL